MVTPILMWLVFLGQHHTAHHSLARRVGWNLCRMTVFICSYTSVFRIATPPLWSLATWLSQDTFSEHVRGPRCDCVRNTSESGTSCSLDPFARPFKPLNIGALWGMPSCVCPHTTFWSWIRHHCWFLSTVVWERESSGRATLRRVWVWGRHLPLLTAPCQWIACAPQPLLLSISKCTLRFTRRIQYHVRVPVLWIWMLSSELKSQVDLAFTMLKKTSWSCSTHRNHMSNNSLFTTY